MLHSGRRIIYRFNQQPPEDVPLAVRSSGSYRLEADSLLDTPARKWFSQVFWGQSGCGEFRLCDKWVRVEGMCLFFLLPGEEHDLRLLRGPWVYHWFTLDHPQSAQWLHAFGLRERPIQMNSCPSHLFRQMFEQLHEGTSAGDFNAAHTAHAILLEALRARKTPFTKKRLEWIEECRRLMDEKYADTELNVTALAEKLGVHRATLFRTFSEHYQMTPSQYLQNRRLHHGMMLLKQTDVPIKDVSTAVGFSDSNYFARQIGKASGFSPKQFRDMYGQNEVGH